MNRWSERVPEESAWVPVDPTRHAIERRIEHAKGRIVEDLNRAGKLLRDVASRTGRGVGRWALVSGVLIAGAIVVAVVRLRGRRIRISWK